MTAVKLLETDRKQSSSKQTKHTRVMHFMVKGQSSTGDMSPKQCPTKEMLGDHFTKPFQGSSFQKFRAEIQGIPADMPDEDLGWNSLDTTSSSSPQSVSRNMRTLAHTTMAMWITVGMLP